MGVSIMKIDLGDKCVHCKKDTSLGSGNFVNRYPVFDLDPLILVMNYWLLLL
jgi:hypothetical protein